MQIRNHQLICFMHTVNLNEISIRILKKRFPELTLVYILCLELSFIPTALHLNEKKIYLLDHKYKNEESNFFRNTVIIFI